MDWKGAEPQPGLCRAESLTITLDLVVTLPQHRRPSELPPDVAASWRRYVNSVAAHEQRHVEIYLEGARRMKSRMEAAVAKPASCAELGKQLRSIWTGQQADVEKAQDQFHVEDEAKSRDDRKPLQTQIDANRARLSALDGEIRGLDRTLQGVARRRDANQAELDAVTAEMTKAHASPPVCGQSSLTGRVQALCRRYGGLVSTYNALIEQHNAAVSRRNTLTDEHNRLVTTTNSLVEALNWTR